MTAFPTHVTPAQMKAAAEALGLDPTVVTHFQADAANGVIVATLALTPDGKVAVASSWGAVIAAHHIPIGPDLPKDQG